MIVDNFKAISDSYDRLFPPVVTPAADKIDDETCADLLDYSDQDIADLLAALSELYYCNNIISS